MDAETRQEITRIDHAIANLTDKIKDVSSDAKDCKKTCLAELREMREKQNDHAERISAYDAIMPRLEQAISDLKVAVTQLTTTVDNLKTNAASNNNTVTTARTLGYEVLKYVILFIVASAFVKSNG